MARTGMVVYADMIVHRTGIIGHGLMNMAVMSMPFMGMALHIAMLMAGVLDLHHIRQTLQRHSAGRKHKSGDRQHKAKGIERDENARGLQPCCSGQPIQHPGTGIQ